MQPCIREGLTPIPDYDVLLVDCSVHGPVGVIKAGEDEFGRAETVFAGHLEPDARFAQLESALRVAKAGEAFGKVAVAERNSERAEVDAAFTALRDAGISLGGESLSNRVAALAAALASAQAALIDMEKKRDAWKEAAGVDYRDLDVTPVEAKAVNEQRQGRIDAALALCEPHPLCHWDTQWPIRAALEGMTPAEYAGEEVQP